MRRFRSQPLPPHAYFVTSAVFHYLGPALAVLLFTRVAPLGVAWLRIASAAIVFAAWRRPWRAPGLGSAGRRGALLGLGAILAAMNCVFYLAIDRLPLATVGAIEFLGPLLLAALGVRGPRNAAAFALAVVGVVLLTRVRLTGDPLGVALALANCALFVGYVVLGARIAADGGAAGIDRLGLAMLVAAALVIPVGLAPAAPAFTHPALLGAGVGVGVCSSVIPYVCDQLALARLPRATFALMMALLPATAAVIGGLVLRQVPSAAEVAGIALVIAGIAVHTPSGGQRSRAARSSVQIGPNG